MLRGEGGLLQVALDTAMKVQDAAVLEQFEMQARAGSDAPLSHSLRTYKICHVSIVVNTCRCTRGGSSACVRKELLAAEGT